jgi:hypothetical protein
MAAAKKTVQRQMVRTGIGCFRNTRRKDDFRGNKRSNIRVRNGIVRVFLILLHGGLREQYRLNDSVGLIQL